MTTDFTNEDLRQIRRQARLTPEQVSCPRCSLRAGRGVPLRVLLAGAIAKFTCTQCGESVSLVLERDGDSQAR